MKKLFGFLGLAVLIGCQTHATLESNINSKNNENKVVQTAAKTFQSIREINFQNFTFPWTEDSIFDEGTFTLKNGNKPRMTEEDDVGVGLGKISYADLTDDGAEEAILKFGVDSGGNGTPTMVFVYSLVNGSPKMLQNFEFDWGSPVRNVYAERGRLIIENYHLCQGDPCCCPSFYELSRYKWTKGKFAQDGKPQKVILNSK